MYKIPLIIGAFMQCLKHRKFTGGGVANLLPKNKGFIFKGEVVSMNSEIEVVTTETIVFPINPLQTEVSEVNSIKIEETIVTEIQTIQTTERFTRLKKSLRKRSRSIL